MCVCVYIYMYICCYSKCHNIAQNTSTIFINLTVLKLTHKLFIEYYLKKAKSLSQILGKKWDFYLNSSLVIISRIILYPYFF